MSEEVVYPSDTETKPTIKANANCAADQLQTQSSPRAAPISAFELLSNYRIQLEWPTLHMIELNARIDPKPSECESMSKLVNQDRNKGHRYPGQEKSEDSCESSM